LRREGERTSARKRETLVWLGGLWCRPGLSRNHLSRRGVAPREKEREREREVRWRVPCVFIDPRKRTWCPKLLNSLPPHACSLSLEDSVRIMSTAHSFPAASLRCDRMRSVSLERKKQRARALPAASSRLSLPARCWLTRLSLPSPPAGPPRQRGALAAAALPGFAASAEVAA